MCITSKMSKKTTYEETVYQLTTGWSLNYAIWVNQANVKQK